MKKISRMTAAFAAAALSAGACTAGAAQVPAFRAEETYAPHGMVAAAHPLAVQAGVEILKQGGNAVDAAAAVSLALNVVEFNASGIGGGGYMTIRRASDGRTVCLNYREMAPASAAKDMFASEKARSEHWSSQGGLSVAVPGLLKGIEYALENYGTMTLGQTAAPAIRLAEQGFELAPLQHGYIADNYDALVQYNDPEKIRLLEDELPLEAGQTLKQPELAAAFRLIAGQGADAFYKGPIGEAVCRAVNAAGGRMTMDDLAAYRVSVTEPVEGTYRGYRICSMPPSSSGGTHVIQLLNIMENFDVKALGKDTPEFACVFADACRHVFADQAKYMADPEFVDIPLKGLMSREYAKKTAALITGTPARKAEAGDPWEFNGSAGDKKAYRGGMSPEQMSTTSFSVVDAEGNMVTATNTINYFLGSKVLVPEYGFFLNNQMNDFSKDPQSVNAPEPRKRPLSSMSPTIVSTPDGRPFMSVGAAGSKMIITTVAQIIMNAVDFGMEMDEAIEQCRIHCDSDSTVLVDKNRADPGLVRGLTEKGWQVSGERLLGAAQGIRVDPQTGMKDGGADSRRLGTAAGW